jgi:hypothetical protein
MAQEHNFTPPCTVEEFRTSLLHIYLHGLRQAVLMIPKARWSDTTHPGLDIRDLWSPDLDDSEVGLSFEDIRDSDFVRAMEQQHQLAAHGVRVPGIEPMDYETTHMWVAAWLVELSTSSFVQEWDSYGCSLADDVTKCLTISELANARQVLDGQESFSHFASLGSSDSHRVELGELSIGQMALLSGMEEMSVRTAASRKGPTQLLTHKNSAGRTVVSIENAKAWLKAKGKYVEVVTRWTAETLDLTKSRFDMPHDLGSALNSHCRALNQRAPERDVLAEAKALLVRHGQEPVLALDPECAGNPQLIGELAELLELPKELFALRVQECMLRWQLGRTDYLIRQLSEAQA